MGYAPRLCFHLRSLGVFELGGNVLPLALEGAEFRVGCSRPRHRAAIVTRAPCGRLWSWYELPRGGRQLRACGHQPRGQ